MAAGLTALMILLFLGSWRSTLIITVSIPLAIFASITALSRYSAKRSNVSDAGWVWRWRSASSWTMRPLRLRTSNYHLEHGKNIEPAILDGAAQIVVPATVSLLCICIAFVPMFGLGGVDRYLFRPLAEAVVFAMIASYALSRTLVPTMAKFLLKAHAHTPGGAHVEHGEGHGHPAPAPTRNPLVIPVQRGFENGVSKGCAMPIAACWRWRCTTGPADDRGVPNPHVIVSFGLFPYLGQNFFPDINSGEIKLHVRAQTGMRLEEVRRQVEMISRKTIHDTIPPDQLASVVDNIGTADQRHQSVLRQLGHCQHRGCRHANLAEGRAMRRQSKSSRHCVKSCRGSIPARPSPSCRPTS